MKSFSRLVLAAVAILALGGGVFLAMWDIPAPVQKIEKEIPDDRFPR